jgi:hypothetical protein
LRGDVLLEADDENASDAGTLVRREVDRPGFTFAVILSGVLALTSCGGQQGGEAPTPAASGKRTERASTCPHPLPLSAEAVARAADQARLEAPELYGADARGVKVAAASIATSGRRGGWVRSECGDSVARRTVVVELFLPAMLPSASLSQGVVFISRFPRGYRVWEVAR